MVSALAKLLRDKSTDGVLSSHGGKVEIDEVKMSFCLKSIVDKSVLTRRPRGRIWFGRLSKSFVNRSSKAQFRAGLLKFEHILSVYCDASRLLRSSMGISFASTCKLVAGDAVLHAFNKCTLVRQIPCLHDATDPTERNCCLCSCPDIKLSVHCTHVQVHVGETCINSLKYFACHHCIITYIRSSAAHESLDK